MIWEHFVFGELSQQNSAPDSAFINELLDRAQQLRSTIQALSIEEIVSILDRVSKLWASESYAPRQQALKHMPEVVGFSPEMVELGLNELSRLCARENLHRILHGELGDRAVVDRWCPHPSGYVRALPLGVIIHVSPGNVFLGAADSLVRGLITKNVNILKVSAGDPVFPLLFARSIQDAAPNSPLAKAFAIVTFKGGDREVEQIFKDRCQGAVVWGGQQAISAWTNDVPLGLRVVPYGPRLSLAIVTRDFLAEAATRPASDYLVDAYYQHVLPTRRTGIEHMASMLALDVVMWEQRGCGSPQVLFLQDSPHGEEFLNALANALHSLGSTIPAAALTRDEEVEILRERELCSFSQLTGQGDAWSSQPGDPARWNILLRRDMSRLGSPLNRTLVVHPYVDKTQVIEALKPYSSVLQSVGVGATNSQLTQFAEDLTACGVTRLTKLGAMHRVTHGAPHDNSFQLDRLLRWVGLESQPGELPYLEEGDGISASSTATMHAVNDVAGRHSANTLSFDALPESASQPATDSPQTSEQALFCSRYSRPQSAIEKLISFACENSPYYCSKFAGHAWHSYEDFCKLPMLDGEDVRRNSPPVSQELLTRPMGDNYIFASGGSTGAPKFSLYSTAEWQHVVDTLALIYSAAGIKAGDVVGNLFMAGSLYTSFLAASEAIAKLGCINLPIAGNADVAQIVRYISLFKPNVIMGLPSIIIETAETISSLKLPVEIPTVLYGGEHFSAEAKQYLSDTLHTTSIVSAGYASVDAGPIGYQCSHCQGTVHHVLDGYKYVEIVNPETGLPVPPGEVGEIVVTCFRRTLVPLIRYRTGDLGNFIAGSCPCGSQSPLFRLAGRSCDILRVGTVSIYPDGIAHVLATFPSLSHLFQIVADREEGKDTLHIKVELLPQAPAASNELAAHVRLAIIRDNCELVEALEKGWLASLTVELVRPYGLPRISRTGKIRQSIDRRQYQ